jgi:hypothetical protein
MLGVHLFISRSRGRCSGQEVAIPMAYTGVHSIDGEPRFDLAHFLAFAGAGR